jgi:succinate-semialdehyde dehydrogenase/glutarate-semialdehyde dehydrogenase
MEFKSINPFDNSLIASYTAISENELEKKITHSQMAFNTWRKVPIATKAQLMTNAGKVLRDNIEEYAKTISLEMGKPLAESRGEVTKCAWVCDYYAQNAEEFLAPEIIKSDASHSFVRHDPIGAVLAIMPWNFPFWQVFRFAAPTLMAGNTALLKHASNVFGSAELIQSVFVKAGFPPGVFQNLIIHHNLTEKIIAHPAVQAVTLTGSELAGSAVASLAGKYIKKSLLELGGNNAFIVLADADIDHAIQIALVSRMLNCGQSCIAAKRFILEDAIYDEFVDKFTLELAKFKNGNPLHPDTQIGPMARVDLANELQKQIVDSIEQGALLILGGNQQGCYHEPTILGNVTPNMPVFLQETFGPVAAMIKVKDQAEAYQLAAQSKFGLGLTVCTQNTEAALAMADEVSDGAFFINEMVKSDPRLPFGGTKYSGYGRELSKDGILEFVNRKTVYLR